MTTESHVVTQQSGKVNPAINDDSRTSLNNDDYECPHRAHHRTRNEEAINTIFKAMMIMTSLQFCVANGALGVSNGISPLLNIYKLYQVNQNVSITSSKVCSTLI